MTLSLCEFLVPGTMQQPPPGSSRPWVVSVFPRAQSAATHPETWRRPALLGHDAKFANTEAHVFADEPGYLHSSDEAVAAVQYW